MTKTIVINGIYQRYKGNKYQVLEIARNESNPKQLMVVYKALYTDKRDMKLFEGNTVWVRAIDDFLGMVDDNTRRFTLCQNPSNGILIHIDY